MRTLTLDTETHLIAPGRLAPRLVCASIKRDTGPAELLDRDAALATLRPILTSPEPPLIVGQNIAYDLGVLCQEDPGFFPVIFGLYDRGRIWDTMIAETLYVIARDWYRFDPRLQRASRFSLADLVEARFGETVAGKTGADAWRLRYHELDGIPIRDWPEAARAYALTDAELTWRVYRSQWDDPQAHLITPNLAAQCASAWSLHLMSAWGLRTDGEMVEAYAAELGAQVQAVEQALQAGGLLKPGGQKNMAAIGARVEQAFAALGQPCPRTATGKPATDRDTLEQSGDPLLSQLAEIGAAQKLLSTYIPVLRRGAERPINPGYYLVSTGRTSARSPNVQNLPRDGKARECYVPRPGWLYVGADYHAAELCSLAQVLLDLFGQSAMAEALQAGRELHLETAAGILGISYDEAVERHKAGDHAVKDARQLAKAANFGFPGGLGPDKFVAYARATYGLQVTVEQAARLKDAWLARYPEMRWYFARMGERVNEDGGATQIEQHRSGRVRGGVGFCDGCNTLFQGLVADGARAALYQVSRECYTVEGSPLYGSRPVLFIHDEIILESPEPLAAGAAESLAAVMVAEMRRFLPDIPVRAEAALMRRWYKGAEPVFGADGRLIPWEPPA